MCIRDRSFDQGDQRRALPQLSLKLGTQKEGFLSSIVLHHGELSESRGSDDYEFRQQGLGLDFGVQSRALRSVLWDLHLGADYMWATAERTPLPTGESAIDASEKADAEYRSVRLHLTPGVMWELDPSYSFGLSTGLHRYLDLARRDRSDLGALPAYAVSMMIRLKTNF